MTSRRSILFVGSCEMLTVEVLSQLCVEAGFSVQRALTSESALENLQQTNVDVIAVFLQKNQAQLEGELKFLQALRASRNLPILAVTSSSDVEMRMRAFKSGATDCLTSPFYFEEVQARLNLALAHGTLHSQRPLPSGRLSVETDTGNRSSLGTPIMCRLALKSEWARSQRHRRPLSLLYWGWTSPSKFVPPEQQDVVNLVQDSFRKEDMLFQMSPNEFVACLPETNIEGAQVVAQRLWRRLSPILSPFSVHIGGAGFPSDRVQTFDGLLDEGRRSFQNVQRLEQNVFWTSSVSKTI